MYDLTVDGEHEFYASGILVHNCLRYILAADNYSVHGEVEKEPEEEESWGSDKLQMHYALGGLDGRFGEDVE